MALWLANTVSVAAPLLGFAAGVFFAKWIGQRRRQRLDANRRNSAPIGGYQPGRSA